MLPAASYRRLPSSFYAPFFPSNFLCRQIPGARNYQFTLQETGNAGGSCIQIGGRDGAWKDGTRLHKGSQMRKAIHVKEE